MSKIFVDQVDPKTGTSLTLGTSGDTVNIPSGVTIANAGTATGFGVSLANGADNRVVTSSSASALNGEANLTFDGATGELALTASGSASGTQTLKVATTGNANPAYTNLVFKTGGNTSGCWIKGVQASGGNDGRLEFHVNNSGTVNEAMRMMFNGKVQIGMQTYGSDPSSSNYGMSLHNTNFGASSFGSGRGTNNHFTFDNERASEISKSSEYKLQKVKQIRLQKLIETDFYALGDVTMSDVMKTYRQNLRDIPANHVDEEAYDALLARD